MYIRDRNFVWSPAQWPPCRKNGRARGWSRNEGTTHSGTREKKNQPPRIHLSSTSWHDDGVSLATPPPGHWRLFLSLSFHFRNRRKPGDVNRGEHRSFATLTTCASKSRGAYGSHFITGRANRKFLDPISLSMMRRGGARAREKERELSNPREGFPVRWSLPSSASRCVKFQFGSSRLATPHRRFLLLLPLVFFSVSSPFLPRPP